MSPVQTGSLSRETARDAMEGRTNREEVTLVVRISGRETSSMPPCPGAGTLQAVSAHELVTPGRKTPLFWSLGQEGPEGASLTRPLFSLGWKSSNSTASSPVERRVGVRI